MKRLAALFMGIVVTAGCSAPQPRLIQSVDPYTQETSIAFGPVLAAHCPGGGYDGVFTVDLSILKQGELQALSIGIEASEWVFMDPDTPLRLLIDEKPFSLTALDGTDRDTKRSHSYVAVTESLYYPIGRAVVSRLASAQSVQFRVPGKRKNVERCVDASSLREFQQVIHLLDPIKPNGGAQRL